MKHLCFKSSLLVLLFFSNLFGFNMAFYYSPDVPNQFRIYDYVVVEPSEIKNIRKNYLAYISIGEIDNYPKVAYKKEWILGKNRNWNSLIANISNKKYQNYLLNRIKILRKKGYKNFFFDTLDSYQMVLPKNKWNNYEANLALFIHKVKSLYPNSKIVLNRGFEVVDKVKKDIFAVVAEGMYQGYDGKKLIKFSNEDRKWLIAKLNHIRSLGIKVVVIDYFDGKNCKEAKILAKKIENLGFVAYITNPELSIVGVSNLNIINRKILIVYTSKATLMNTDAHRLIQLPLEYMGYKVEYKKVDKAVKLKSTIDKYYGIIVVPELGNIKNSKYKKWITDRIKNGNKVVFMENFGFDFDDFFGVKSYSNNASPFDSYKILKKSKMIGYEIQIPPTLPDTLYYSKGGELVIKNNKNLLFSPVTITPWGGYVLADYMIDSFSNDVKWVINPFEFLKKALRLKTFPVPDYTTENGMRVFYSHLDGDASVVIADFNPNKIGCEIIRDEIIKKYKTVPFGISFIAAELLPNGPYPTKYKRAQKCARDIYKIKNIEPASHSYSHPFFWQKSAIYEGKILPKDWSLKIRGYKFNYFQEVVGSCRYLSKYAPKNKPVRLLFWSGDCDPPAKAVVDAYQNGILNMNGGDTTIRIGHKYLSDIAPAGIKKGKYYQVYDGEQDEYIYTDGFTKNFGGYRRVVETFKLTDKPIRFKPIDVYFHFYIGSKIASLNSFKYVLNWVLKQDVIPIKVSEYIKKVLDFYGAIIAKDGKYWIVKTDTKLRTLRVNKNFGYVDIKNSKGVIGFYPYNDSYYISLNGSGYYKIKFTKEKPNYPYLLQSNARIVYPSTYKNLHLKSNFENVKVKFSKKCKIKSNQKYKLKNGFYIFDSKNIRLKIE